MKKAFLLKLDEDFHSELKKKCIDLGKTMQSFIIEAIKEKLRGGK